MMTVEHARDDDVRFVAANMRAKDAEEFLALTHAADRAALVDSLLDRYGGHPAAIAVHDDGGPVCIGAGIEHRPNVITLLLFATDRFPGVALPLTRFVTRELFYRWKVAGAHRIEAVSMEGHDEAHRWIELLGLEREAELRGYGKNGETFIQFAWVADHVRASGA